MEVTLHFDMAAPADRTAAARLISELMGGAPAAEAAAPAAEACCCGLCAEKRAAVQAERSDRAGDKDGAAAAPAPAAEKAPAAPACAGAPASEAGSKDGAAPTAEKTPAKPASAGTPAPETGDKDGAAAVPAPAAKPAPAPSVQMQVMGMIAEYGVPPASQRACIKAALTEVGAAKVSAIPPEKLKAFFSVLEVSCKEFAHE